MTEPEPTTPPVSDEQVIHSFTRTTLSFCGALVVVLVLGLFFAVPDSSVRTRGMIIGVALGLVSWFGSRWITGRTLSRVARTGTKEPTGAIGVVVFLGIAVAEFPALLGLVFEFVSRGDVGAVVVAVPVAIVSIVVNASGPGAVRRHLDRLRAGAPA
jgi:hypothetical protein